MKKSILLIVIATSLACGSRQKKEVVKLENLYDELTIIHIADQEYRGLEKTQDPFFNVLYSKIEEAGLSRSEYTKLSKDEQLEYGKRARAVADTISRISKEEEKALMQLQIKNDKVNTQKLIDITKEYGFPNIEKLGCEGYAAPFLIFGHSREEYWPEIAELIEIEKAANRIVQGDYDYIKWHIGGREGTPGPSTGDDIQIFSD